LVGGINLYVYSRNNPANYTDSNGLLVDGGVVTVPLSIIAFGKAVAFVGSAAGAAGVIHWLMDDDEDSDEPAPNIQPGGSCPNGPDDDDEKIFTERLKRAKSKSDRKRWVDDKGRIYEWDRRHKELEVYNKRGVHVGVRDPNTGRWIKPRVKGRRIEP